ERATIKQSQDAVNCTFLAADQQAKPGANVSLLVAPATFADQALADITANASAAPPPPLALPSPTPSASPSPSAEPTLAQTSSPKPKSSHSPSPSAAGKPKGALIF